VATNLDLSKRQSPQWLEDFNRDGYAVIRNVFSLDEVAALRKAMEDLKVNQAKKGTQRPLDPQVPDLVYFYGDMLSAKGIDHLVFDDRLVNVAKAILGPHIVYWGDSTYHFGKGYRGFHKDCVDRSDPEGLDWKSEYDVIRMGIYLQDHERYSGGIKMRKGSHLYPDLTSGRAVDVPSHSTDLVVWKLTTTHSGNAVRCRFFPRTTLQNRWENRLPDILALPEQKERHTLLFTYGRPGIHLDRYIKYCVDRGDYHEHWRHSSYDEKLLERSRRLGIEIRKPTSDYGSAFRI
jgi:hypothetical protein